MQIRNKGGAPRKTRRTPTTRHGIVNPEEKLGDRVYGLGMFQAGITIKTKQVLQNNPRMTVGEYRNQIVSAIKGLPEPEKRKILTQLDNILSQK